MHWRLSESTSRKKISREQFAMNSDFITLPNRCDNRWSTYQRKRRKFIAQGEGDLPRAAALLALPHSKADYLNVETQVYQAILERRPAQIIPRLKEMLAKPDPALGYYNGELRFWLGWAQEVAGDHAAAQETWRQARSELESFLKEQPENFFFFFVRYVDPQRP
jgi:hypothetical protein